MCSHPVIADDIAAKLPWKKLLQKMTLVKNDYMIPELVTEFATGKGGAGLAYQ